MEALQTSRARELRRNATTAEGILWGKLRARRLSGWKFRRQQPIGDFIVDFVCIEARLVVELDGGQHAEERHRRDDEERGKQLADLGFRVIRFWNHELLAHPDAIL